MLYTYSTKNMERYNPSATGEPKEALSWCCYSGHFFLIFGQYQSSYHVDERAWGNSRPRTSRDVFQVHCFQYVSIAGVWIIDLMSIPDVRYTMVCVCSHFEASSCMCSDRYSPIRPKSWHFRFFICVAEQCAKTWSGSFRELTVDLEKGTQDQS